MQERQDSRADRADDRRQVEEDREDTQDQLDAHANCETEAAKETMRCYGD